MKIKILTITLITLLLMLAFLGYWDKKMLDDQRDLCNMYSEKIFENISDPANKELSEPWGDCLDEEQYYGTKYLNRMYLITIFIFLIAMSIKIDNPNIGKFKK